MGLFFIISSAKFNLSRIFTILAFCALYVASPISQAYDVGSRILATGGASQVEGSAGGGIVPWAVLSGYGQTGEWGGNVFGTYIETDDYDVSAAGISVSYNNRVEVSIATQILGIDAIQSSLGLPDDEVKQTIIGAKVRLFGDLIYGDAPQVSLGIQYKKNTDFDVPAIAGALDDDGVDYYISASRLWLSGIYGYPLLVNATLRSTKANQLGLLGFGGDLNNSHEFVFEGSVGLLLRRDLVVGFEYREKPNNLSFAQEDDWKDVFIGWFPNKHLSLVGAWADLGDVAGKKNQDGFYLSIEGSY